MLGRITQSGVEMAAKTQGNRSTAYKNTEISTADQKKLIVMLYDGAIRFLQVAVDNMRPQNYDMVNTHIIKAQDIITELMLALNMEQGGKIAANLFNIYAYLKKQLLEANITKDPKILMETSSMLQELREAWDKAEAKTEDRENLVESGLGLSIQG